MAVFSRKKIFGDLKVMGESGHWTKLSFKYGRVVKMERNIHVRKYPDERVDDLIALKKLKFRH